VIGILGLVLLAAVVPTPLALADPGSGKPTVVLVHGAWADASGWAGVAERLRNDGYPVVTTTNPMRSLSGDAAYVSSILGGIDGPIVLVGHSYGGAIITNAAAGNPRVEALVYIEAFAPDAGENVLSLVLSMPGSQVPLALVPKPYLDNVIGIDTYLDHALFHEVFCADVPDEAAKAMADSQRPLSLGAGAEATTQVAWKTIPSWFLVAQNDRTIPPDLERMFARRAGSHTVEIPSSHAAMVSNPGPVTDLLRAAAQG
jgi:pimeloyl-ACP methyl ester carboxylesterase